VVNNVAVTAPTNNSWTNLTAVNSTNFTFSFVSGIAPNASCEIYVTNSTGSYIASGLDSTVFNNTAASIANNQTFTNGLITNWTVNCTYNGSQITAVDNGYYILNVDNANPGGMTLNCNSVFVGGSRECSCSATDNSVVMGGTISYAYSGDSTATAGSTTATCTATDLAGNTNQTSIAYNVVASSSSSSGGGSAQQQVLGDYAKEIWTVLDPGTTTTLEVANGVVGVTSVEFDTTEKVWGAWMKVERKDSLPVSVNAFSGTVYKNIEITKSIALKEELIKDAKVDFKVTKAWLTENKVGKANIALYRYVDSKWVELSTVLGEDDGTYVHYTATTPGFSYFVIAEKVSATPLTTEEVAKEAAEGGAAAVPEEAPAEAVAEGAAAGEASAPVKIPWKWIVPIIIAIIAIAALVWLMKKK